METVFEAESGLEAHMIVHLLEQSGIKAQVLGEHLQGGVGELPAHGNIRVAVEAGDVDAARRVIADWESTKSAIPSTPGPRPDRSIYPGFFAFLAGLATASAFLLWAYNSPVDEQFADFNRDGKVDEWIYWRGGTVSRVESDRNFDGEVDSVQTYSARNYLESGELDNDFDGIFEVRTEYRFANPTVDHVDTNADGVPDRRNYYTNGVLVRVDILDPTSMAVRKRQEFQHGVRLTEAGLDSDNDGVLDTLIKYDAFEEEVSRSPVSEDQ